MSSFIDVASGKIYQAFGNKELIWKLKPDLLESNNRLVLYAPNSNKIEVVDLSSMAAYSMMLPFEIESILLASEKKWLIQTNSRKKYVLVKSLPTNPCPNILKEIEEVDSDATGIGSFLASSKESLKENILSSAVNQNINSPNRLLATDNTFATIVIGFPELDSANEVFLWPRQERSKNSSPPIVTEHGQIVRIVSLNEVPKEASLDGRKQTEVSAYLEVVDTINHKARYLPIPQ